MREWGGEQEDVDKEDCLLKVLFDRPRNNVVSGYNIIYGFWKRTDIGIFQDFNLFKGSTLCLF